MHADDPSSGGNEFTDEQLDALLDSADQELLHYIQASTDPTATLAKLMAIQQNADAGSEASAPAGAASKPRRLAGGRHIGSQRRSWRTLRLPATAAAAVALLAAVVGFVVGSHLAHTRASAAPPEHSISAPERSVASAPIAAAPGLPAQGSAASAGHSIAGCSASAPGSGWESLSAKTIPFAPGQAKLSSFTQRALNSVLQTFRQYRRYNLVTITITASTGNLHHAAQTGKIARERTHAVCDWFISHHVSASHLHADNHAGTHAGSAIGNILDINIYVQPTAHPARGATSTS